jgi:uncharacterized protein YbcI
MGEPPTTLDTQATRAPGSAHGLSGRGTGHTDAGAPNSTLAVISRRIVSLVKEFYGKGPTHARTYHFGDVVLVLLRGGYTPVEKTLLADGFEQAVTDQRNAFQEVMAPRFQRVIEEELRREVIAFMSAIHHGPDLNAEVFVLAPEPRQASTDADAGPAVDEDGGDPDHAPRD